MTEQVGALVVHRAERADALAGALAGLLATPLPDPFTPEVVAVPARGVERWLAQRLSHHLGTGASGDTPGADGICAGVDFPSPSALLHAVVAAATGTDPDADPWHPARLVWPLLEVIDEHAHEPWCASLGAHLGVEPRAGGHSGRGESSRADSGGFRRGRRYGTARRLAELFASYAAHRPQLLRSWAGGDVGQVASDLDWQPQLWRRLRDRVGGADPAERWSDACAVLEVDPGRVPLPARVSLFGPTRLPAAHLAVLVALARHREVHLWLPHPSPALWDRVAATFPAVDVPAVDVPAVDVPAAGLPAAALPPAGAVVPRRADDPTAGVARHPLLSSLGRDVRELQVRLATAAPAATHRHHRLPDPPSTVLGRLQRSLRDDLPSGPVPAVPETVTAADRSVEVHACHGPHRQVEVLRELIVGMLADDQTLEPRDILVMCPDVETFAPLISAAFGLGGRGGDAGAGDTHPGHRLQVRLADRALRQVNPLLDTVATLLELADSRLTAAQVLDLLATEPVRWRFRLDDNDLDRLRVLAVRAGVRWGLDAEHRGRYRLQDYRQGTWAAGLDRLLLGVAMSGAGEPEWLGTALPMAEVDSGDTTAIGHLTEFIDRLGAVLRSLTGERPLSEWIGSLLTALDLLTDTTATDAWQDSQARAELAAAEHAAGPHAGTIPLGLADVRGLLADRLRGRPTRAGFRTGTITVATLVPMRSVPHRVVCLLGLDDGVFPRATVPDGDDLLAREPLVGERDPRSEDRQLLLDAICAATERLLVVHSGADERTGARRPPAVPLGELLDAITAIVGVDGARRLQVRHPLQPFHPRNFTPGALTAARAFSFDRAELAGAVATVGPKARPAALLPSPLPAAGTDGGTVALDDLATFLEHPVKGFLRQRVGLPISTSAEPAVDALPVQLDGLATWAIGDRLLRDRLAGHALDRCRQAEWRRGELPPGALGDALLIRVLDDVEPLVAAAAPMRLERLPDVDIDIDTDIDTAFTVDTGPDTDVGVAAVRQAGRRLVGSLGELYRGPGGPTLLRVEYSRLAPKQRIRAWVRLLALVAATGEPWVAVTIGRGQHHGLAQATLGPLDRAGALATLGDLMALRDAGMCEPLPLATVTGHAYARARLAGASADDAAAEAMRKWSGGAGAERSDDAHRQVWGAAAGTEVLLRQPGRRHGEPTRFGALALALWEPLLHVEDMVRL